MKRKKPKPRASQKKKPKGKKPGKKSGSTTRGKRRGKAAPAIREALEYMELMEKEHLRSLSIRVGKKKIEILRGESTAGMPVPAGPEAGEISPKKTTSPPSPETPTPEPDENVYIVKSPMNGTFYASSHPDKPPFVKNGIRVVTDTTLCIIEAMKIMNEIKAEASGKLVEIMVKNGEAVTEGTPLFKIELG